MNNYMVHMLATDKDSSISLSDNGVLIYLTDQRISTESTNLTSQHLYITSDEEIKERDWCIYKNSFGGIVRVCQAYRHKDDTRMLFDDGTYNRTVGEGITPQYSDIRKIVATTNPELWWTEQAHSSSPYDTPTRLIVGISQSFIKEYVDKQGSIKEVKLDHYEYDSDPGGYHEVLKLDSDGCVIILPIEEGIDWEQVFDNAQSMHLQEFISYYKK